MRRGIGRVVSGRRSAASPRVCGALARTLRRVAVVVVGIFVLIPSALILLYRFVPPPTTPLMLYMRLTQSPIEHQWVPITRISPFLIRAVIAGEDQKFCSHAGFDWEAISDALARNANSRILRGASTISQQTAKNLLLPTSRTWLRKGVEAYLTVLLEALLPKRRILELYLNIAQWGPSRFGAEAGARANFGISAASLNALQAARLAAILPNPVEWRADDPGPYVSERSDQLIRQMALVTRDGLAACVLP